MHRWQNLKDFFYGMTGYEFVRHAEEMKREAEAVFLIVTLGELVGIPIMPPVFSMRLLPLAVPAIEMWKRQLARRKEFWEKDEFDLHGV